MKTLKTLLNNLKITIHLILIDPYLLKIASYVLGLFIFLILIIKQIIK